MTPKQLLPLLLAGTFAIAGCTAHSTHAVNGAKICDAHHQTPTLEDDCDRMTGTVYNPALGQVLWVGGSNRETVVIERNYTPDGFNRDSYNPGETAKLKKPVATTSSGKPVTKKNGKVKTLRKTGSSNKVTATPTKTKKLRGVGSSTLKTGGSRRKKRSKSSFGSTRTRSRSTTRSSTTRRR